MLPIYPVWTARTPARPPYQGTFVGGRAGVRAGAALIVGQSAHCQTHIKIS